MSRKKSYNLSRVTRDKGAHMSRISGTYLTALQLPTIIFTSMTRGQFARPTELALAGVFSLRRLTLALELLPSTLLLDLRGLLLISHAAAG
jgi:hypothetical protein